MLPPDYSTDALAFTAARQEVVRPPARARADQRGGSRALGAHAGFRHCAGSLPAGPDGTSSSPLRRGSGDSITSSTGAAGWRWVR